MTKDERFLIEIYRITLALNNHEAVVNPQEIAKALGYKSVATSQILKGLRQANLIKIYHPDEIVLTERGCAVARALLS